MFRRRTIPFLVLFALACSGERDTPTSPGRGSLRVDVVPNPITATKVAGTSDTYDIPFEVVIAEIGGESVTVRVIHADVKAFGVRVFSKRYDESYLRGRGYSNVIAAGSTVRYRFDLRESIPDAAFGSNVEADIRVEGVDAKGNSVRQTTTVSLRRA